MPFIPFIPFQASTPRAQELARELEGTIERYRQLHPDVSRREIRHALFHARRAQGMISPGPLLGAAVAAGVALVLGLQVYLREATPVTPGTPSLALWPMIALGVAIMAIAVLFASRR
jgi:hypothetical protein